MSVNKVILIGRLGQNPEMKNTASGMAIAKLNVATSRRVKKGEEWVEETEWTRVTAFGKTAEACGRFLEKGRQVYVEGRLQTSTYEKDGEKRYTTEVIADTVQFLGDKRSDGGQGGGKHRDSRVIQGETWGGGGIDDTDDLGF